jgi:CheY-like chemotaxis protein
MLFKGRILVVDDEADTLSLIELTLGQAGYTVVSAMSGEEALQKLEGDRFDVVLLDIMMPEVSGFEVLTRLRGAPKPPPPVIILTARGRAEDRERGKVLGACAYLIKPVTRGELLDTVQKAMGSSSVPNAAA